MISKIIQIMPPQFKRRLENYLFTRFDRYGVKSYSQEGEDMILRRIFEKQNSGFYVDVGAHHPKRFSNTYYFYKRGWRGINIDAAPGSMMYFNKYRKSDINLEIPVSDINENLVYYVFDDPALSGFSKKLSEEREKNTKYKVIRKIELQTRTLKQILDEYLPGGTKIDFLSVDVEGLDLNVLRSNDWNKYRPGIVLAEALQTTLDKMGNNELVKFMISNYYEVFAKSFNTFFFRSLKNE